MWTDILLSFNCHVFSSVCVRTPRGVNGICVYKSKLTALNLCVFKQCLCAKSKLQVSIPRKFVLKYHSQ